MSEPKKTYVLTLSEEQAQTVVRALDAYSRIGIGQFENVLEVYDNGKFYHDEAARTFINHVKQVLGHPANGSHGIHNPKVNDRFRVAYDVQQVLRNRLALDRNPQGGMTVDFDTPRAISEQPLPGVKSYPVAG